MTILERPARGRAREVAEKVARRLEHDGKGRHWPIDRHDGVGWRVDCSCGRKGPSSAATLDDAYPSHAVHLRALEVS